jgi:hypothetical protein
MNITFRTRQYERSVDAGFSLYDGDKLTYPDWHVGDTVSFMFTASEEIAAAMEEYQPCDDYQFRAFDGYVHIPCVVVFRHHSAVWRDVGKFQMLTDGVTLEAKTGHWEDVLVWVTTGKKPSWVPN